MRSSFIILIIVLLMLSTSNAQRVFIIDSLADDEFSYPYDDPNTQDDESIDGICEDELGRCTIRAAIDEAWNMNHSVDITFLVSGTIALEDVIYVPDNSSINGDNRIEMTGSACLVLANNSLVKGLRFSNSQSAITVEGSQNQIGEFPGYNEFLDCDVAIVVDGDYNKILNNYIGITAQNQLHPNNIGIMSFGWFTTIGDGDIGNGNTICGNTIAGISLGIGETSLIQGNYIGTNFEGLSGLGNAQGIMIGGSRRNIIGGYEPLERNVISGNTVYGIFISGAPPKSYSDENYILNNIIGLNPQETAALPNNFGIVITNGVISGIINDNIISGNNLDGISIFAYDEESFSVGQIIGGNRIGVNSNGSLFGNGGSGINILGYVENVRIGTDELNDFDPNIIVGNTYKGINVESQFGYSPKGIRARKNVIYQNSYNNFSVDGLSNSSIASPYSLSFNNSTIAGIHNIPNSIIDVYRANILEAHPSAYEWLGATTTDANGVFSFDVLDPIIEAISLTATSPLGNTSNFATLEILTGLETEESVVTEFSLEQNYPNPFNPSTTIKYMIPNITLSGVEGSRVQLKIYDVLGNEVATLVNEEKPAGVYEVDFNASSLSSGIYFYKLNVGSFTETKKMLLLK
jgi:hypothetical protein